MVLVGWGLALVVAGAGLASTYGFRRGNALGQGSPLLMIIGGAVTVTWASALWAIVRPRTFFLSFPRRWLKLAQFWGFGLALLILLAGIVRHDPRRDILIVALTSFAMAISVTARWWELRTRGLPAA